MSDEEEPSLTGLAEDLLRGMARLVGAARAAQNAAYYRLIDRWAGEDGARQTAVYAALSQTNTDCRARRRDGKPVIRRDPGAYLVGIIRRECVKRGWPRLEKSDLSDPSDLSDGQESREAGTEPRSPAGGCSDGARAARAL